MRVGADYDSLLAKVIAWGEDRTSAIQRLRRALNEYQIGGVVTSIDFIQQIINSPQFSNADVTTSYLETLQPEFPVQEIDLERELAWAAALLAHQQRDDTIHMDASQLNLWRSVAWKEQMNGNV
jgi:acetyl/propionyl-CoA carboxylase alpha subunit